MNIKSKILLWLVAVVMSTQVCASYEHSFAETVTINEDYYYSGYLLDGLDQAREALNQHPEITGIEIWSRYLNTSNGSFLKTFNNIHQVRVFVDCPEDGQLEHIVDNQNIDELEIRYSECPVHLNELAHSSTHGDFLKKITIKDSPVEDFKSLTQLKNLEYVDFKGTADINDIQSLIRMENIKTISLNLVPYNQEQRVKILKLINQNPHISGLIVTISAGQFLEKEADLLSKNQHIRYVSIDVGYDLFGSDSPVETLNAFMSAISKIKSIEALELLTNKIDLQTVKYISEMKTLKKLTFDNLTEYSESFSTYLAKLQNLEYLDAQCSFGHEMDYKILLKSSSLKYLNINNCKNFDDKSANLLAHNNKIKVLKATRTNLRDDGATALSHVSTLESLDISSTQVGDEGVRALALSQSIKELELNSLKISTGTIKVFSTNSVIEKLEINSNNILDVDIIDLAKNTSLRKLVAANNWLTEKSAIALSGSNISELILTYNRVTESGKDALRKRGGYLQLSLGCQFKVPEPWSEVTSCWSGY